MAEAEEVPDGGFHAGVVLPVPVHPEEYLPQVPAVGAAQGDPDVLDAACSLDLCQCEPLPGGDVEEVHVGPGGVVA